MSEYTGSPQSDDCAGFFWLGCGAQLAENPDVAVLLLEAGGNDDVPNVMEAVQWPLNRFSERNCGFLGQPSLYPNGHSIPLAMGKVVSHCPEPVSQS